MTYGWVQKQNYGVQKLSTRGRILLKSMDADKVKIKGDDNGTLYVMCWLVMYCMILMMTYGWGTNANITAAGIDSSLQLRSAAGAIRSLHHSENHVPPEPLR